MRKTRRTVGVDRVAGEAVCRLNKRRSCACLHCSSTEFLTEDQKNLTFLLSLLLLLLRFLLGYQMSVRLGLVNDRERIAIWACSADCPTNNDTWSSLQSPESIACFMYMYFCISDTHCLWKQSRKRFSTLRFSLHFTFYALLD
jgi:hypothetical protein